MKKSLYIVLIAVAVILLAVRFFSLQLPNFLGVRENMGLRITSVPDQADVYIDNELIGKTPFEEKNVKKNEVLIKLVSSGNKWEGKVSLNPGTSTVVQRKLSPDTATGSGEILTLEKGTGVSVISSPVGAMLDLDGVSLGVTPLTADVTAGEHIFVVKKNNFLMENIKASVPDGFHLTINVDLSLTEADLSSIVLPITNTLPTVKVGSTPTGFLRVRDKPSLSGKEIGRVAPGDELLLLEKEANWDKVRLSNGEEGYVSALYIISNDNN